MGLNKILEKFSGRSEFLKNSITLISGSAISQVLPILAAPVLARLYQPDDYGILAIYMSIIGLVGIFSTLQYSTAILLPEKDEDADALVGLCLMITVSLSVIILLVLLFLKGPLLDMFNARTLDLWIWAAPASIFMNGITVVFSMLASRQKEFKVLSFNRVFCTIGSVGTSLVIGSITHSVMGLFAGLLISQLAGCIHLTYYTIFKKNKFVAIVNYSRWKTLAVKFSNFPKFSLPADFINTFSNQIPVLMLNRFANTAATGYYNMSNRMLGLPITFLSSSIGEVFRQKAASDYATHGTCRPIFIKTLKVLFFISIIPFSVLIIWGADLFAFVFSEKWRFAGTYTQIMGVMFFFRFIVSPLTYMYYIAEKQKEDLVLHIIFLVVCGISLYIGLVIMNSTIYALILFTISYTLIYCIYLIRSYVFTTKPAVE